MYLIALSIRFWNTCVSSSGSPTARPIGAPGSSIFMWRSHLQSRASIVACGAEDVITPEAEDVAGDTWLQVVKGLPGTITVLIDSGYSPSEILRWLFTADESLPGTPIEALRGDRGREVKRRAQALAF